MILFFQMIETSYLMRHFDLTTSFKYNLFLTKVYLGFKKFSQSIN